MKLIISLTLVWTLCGTARALTCLECTNPLNPGCSNPLRRPCLEDQLCFNGLSRDQDGFMRIYRECVGGSVCTAPTSGIVSYTVGGVNSTTVFTCCDTDDCNNEELELPEIPDDNGQMCPGSEAPDDEFFGTVSCTGDQRTCFMGTTVVQGNNVQIGGCGTSNVCDFTNTFRALPFQFGFFGDEVTCTEITTTTTTTTTTTSTTETSTTETSTTETSTTEEPTTTNKPLSEKQLLKVKFLLVKLKLLVAAIDKVMVQQQKVVLFKLQLQMIEFQLKLVLQQMALPIDHYHQLPLYYQQSLLVSQHQLLLHHIYQSLSGQSQLSELVQKQKEVLYELETLLHGHHYLLYNHDKPDPTSSITEEPTTTTTQAPTTTAT